MPRLDFFYFFGSVYAGLTVLRIRAAADRAGVDIRWRPFNVRPLMKENNVALRNEAQKVPYMWRDIDRRAALHGLSGVRTPPWPTDPELLHNKVGALAAEDGWGEAFTVASMEAWLIGGMPLGDMACLTHVLEKLRRDPAVTIAEAQGPRAAALYDSTTEAARSHGIFGSPSFVTEDGEMFWGDDRLEEALAWATGSHPLQLSGSR
jgi:2-hydroxychromene-2-carboxylate isomerase